MTKPPKPKLVDVRITAIDPATRKPIASAIATGFIEQSESGGTEFYGRWEAKHGVPKKLVAMTFSDDLLREAGQPKRATKLNMTRILQNRIARHRYNEESKEFAEQFAGRVYKTFQRSWAAERHSIRTVQIGYDDDGKLVAFAFMDDGVQRPNPVSGPAWVLTDGDKIAHFVPNVEPAKE